MQSGSYEAPAGACHSAACSPQSTVHSLQPSSHGIALIMVLGILSVMVILAVAFAISMRTERVAAGNYADSVRARQLVHAGLARALNDLATQLGTNGLASIGGKSYPPWVVTNSYTNAYTNTSVNVYLLYATNGSTRANDATNYVPRALWAAATNADYSNGSNQWLPLDSLIYTSVSPTNSPAESNRMGRVKYLILNCSGLLDANYVGGASGTEFINDQKRGMASNPADIAIWRMTEFQSPTRDFLSWRATDVRYETMREVNVLAGINKPATNLFVYSLGLPGYWNAALNSVGTQVNLSGSAADLVSRSGYIINAFTNAGFSSFEAGVLYSNLIDYVDDDVFPQNYEYCVEAVPMINEVVVSNRVAMAALGASQFRYTVSGAVYIECWYPFAEGSTQFFNLNSVINFAEEHGIQPDNISGALSLGTPSAGQFIVIMRPFTKTIDTPTPVDPIKLVSTVTLYVSLASGGVAVDQCSLQIIMTNQNPGSVGSGQFSLDTMACRDPRFNSNPNNTNEWRHVSIDTLGNVNTWPTGIFPADSDGEWEMYVANRPLRAVAELGYLVYTNTPWKTVKLYGTNLHRVLDVVGLSTNAGDVWITNLVYYGRVNCNSNPANDATAVIFAGMPVDKYPGGPSNSVSMLNAQVFRQNIFAGGAYTNLSDIGRNLLPNSSSFPLAATELERESYFRNSINLINLRQNLFMIIIEAQVASGGNIPSRPVRQRAIAIVWRDPYTGEMFVRSITWLKN